MLLIEIRIVRTEDGATVLREQFDALASFTWKPSPELTIVDGRRRRLAGFTYTPDERDVEPRR